MHGFDGRTDGRTDGQTDRNPIAIPRLHSMQRGKQYRYMYSRLTYSLKCMTYAPKFVNFT